MVDPNLEIADTQFANLASNTMIQTITEGGGGGRSGYGYGRSYSGGGDFAFAMKDSFSGYGSYLYVSADDVCGSLVRPSVCNPGSLFVHVPNVCLPM